MAATVGAECTEPARLACSVVAENRMRG